MNAVDQTHLSAAPEIPLLAQTKSYVVCIKPRGVLSESTPTGDGLPELLSAQLSLPHIYPVHRLDATTGGVMVYATTKSAAFRPVAAAASSLIFSAFSWLSGAQALALPLLAMTPRHTPSSR